MVSVPLRGQDIGPSRMMSKDRKTHEEVAPSFLPHKLSVPSGEHRGTFFPTETFAQLLYAS